MKTLLLCLFTMHFFNQGVFSESGSLRTNPAVQHPEFFLYIFQNYYLGSTFGWGTLDLGVPGTPGAGSRSSGGHKWPFVTNFQILVIQSFFAQMRSYRAQMMSPGLNFWNMVKNSGKSHMGLLRPPEGVLASAANNYSCEIFFFGSEIFLWIFGT